MVLINFPLFNPFHATGIYLSPLSTSENFWFSDVFWGHGKEPVAWNGLMGCSVRQTRIDNAQAAFTCSKLTKETLEQCVKYVQS